MVPYLSEREKAIENISAMCLRLFNEWCESRSVEPLALLLRAWPLTNSDPEAVRRLGNALRELRRRPLPGVSCAAFEEICELSECVEDLLILSSLSTWARSSG